MRPMLVLGSLACATLCGCQFTPEHAALLEGAAQAAPGAAVAVGTALVPGFPWSAVVTAVGTLVAAAFGVHRVIGNGIKAMKPIESK